MNILERAKGIILKPKDEWNIISSETPGVDKAVSGYLLPLALIPAIASLIGFGFLGYGHLSSVGFGISQAIANLIITIGGVFITAYVVDILAPSFGAEKNFTKAFSLVSFAYTPQLIAGIVLLLPPLAFIIWIAAIYGLYILFLGIKPMMKCPDDKSVVYFIVILAVTILVTLILSTVISGVIVGSIFSSVSGF